MTHRAVRAFAPLVALLLAGTVAAASGPAACLPVDGGGELSVAGLGRFVFGALATDRTRDAASLTGDVCLVFDAIDGVLRTERLELAGLSAKPTLTASEVTLELPGWVLTAVTLQADGATAELWDVAMEGSEAVARAAAATIDLSSGHVAARDLRLVTETVWLDARRGTFDGRYVWASDAALTTCDCPPEASPMRLEAAAVRLELATARLRLEGGVLHLSAVAWALPDPLEVDEASLADVVLPLTLGMDPLGERGLVLSVRERAPAEGIRYAWDVGSGEDGRPPDVGVRLSAASDGATVELVGGSERLRVAWRLWQPLAAGWGFAIGQRLEAGDWDEPVRDQDLTLDWATRLVPAAPLRLDLAASATAALSAQTLEGVEVVGGRWGVEARLAAASVDPGWSRWSVGLTAAASRYPAQGTSQAWVAVAPSWGVRIGAWQLDLDHLSRWVVGESPFGSTLDRRAAAHRTDLALTTSTPVADGWRLATSLAVRLDWRTDPERPGRLRGVERLRLRLDLDGPAWGGRWAFVARSDLAGWVDPRPERTSTAAIGGTWTRDRLELGARAAATWEAGVAAWDELTVFAAWPFAQGDWAWRPYLAFDLAALADDGAGWWSGHGLDLAWTSCCGTVEVGYRHDAAVGTRVHAGVTFETRPLDLGRLAGEAGAPAAAAAR